jgi:2-polyprenyl-3-methyl-5-hydroxy-6-metoxy-1,4-benzoquinol methylase
MGPSSVTYCRKAVENITFPAARFDLVVSSLVLHYVDDYSRMLSRVADWLAPGGVLVYSTEHPGPCSSWCALANRDRQRT